MIQLIWTDEELNHIDKTPYTWGLDTVNQRFGKPDNWELITFVWYPSVWKTEYTHFIARENAERWIKVCYISLELTNQVMWIRYACKKAWVDIVEYQDKTYNQHKKDLLNKYYKEFINIPNLEVLSITNTIKVDDLVRHRKTLDDTDWLIREYFDKWYRMFIIDNLWKIGWPENENARFDEITSKLQSIKNELWINIILLHHLKKSFKKEDQYKAWWVSWIRWSQKIIDNSTQVIEIWRDLDPEQDDPSEKCRVKLFQYKNTITWMNWYAEIYFNKWIYQENNPYEQPVVDKKQTRKIIEEVYDENF
jgi:hypothetical protein